MVSNVPDITMSVLACSSELSRCRL